MFASVPHCSNKTAESMEPIHFVHRWLRKLPYIWSNVMCDSWKHWPLVPHCSTKYYVLRMLKGRKSSNLSPFVKKRSLNSDDNDVSQLFSSVGCCCHHCVNPGWLLLTLLSNFIRWWRLRSTVQYSSKKISYISVTTMVLSRNLSNFVELLRSSKLPICYSR